MSAVSTFYAFKFIKLLVKDFTEWEAYELGLIDENGDTIKEPQTKEEKDSLNKFTTLVKNIKKTIERVPGMDSTLGSFSAAAFLMKEEGYEDIAKEIMKEKNLSEEEVEKAGRQCLTETTTTGAVPTGPNIGPQPTGRAAGIDFFDVNQKTFNKAFQGKKMNKHWRKFLDDDENAENVRQFVKKNPKRSIMFRNRNNPSEFLRIK